MMESKYELKKTVKFKLIEKHVNKRDARLYRPSLIDKNAVPEKISMFIKKIEDVFKHVKLLFFDDKGTKRVENRYEKIKFTKNLEIKYLWLKKYTKNEFYDFLKENQKKKKYAIGEVLYLNDLFRCRINEWLDVLTALKKLDQMPLEKQERKREFAFYFKSLCKRSNLEFMKEFVKAIHNNNKISYENWKTEVNVDQTLECLNRKFREIEADLRDLCRFFVPAENLGLELLRATFNYNTLNKTPIEYDQEIKEEKNKLDDPVSPKLFSGLKIKGRETKPFHCDESWFNKIGFSKYQQRILNKEKWSLNKAYCEIKKWKADEKSKFIEKISKTRKSDFNEKCDEIMKKYPLFKPEITTDLKDFFDKTLRIKRLSILLQEISSGKIITNDDKDLLSKNELCENPVKIKEKIIEIKKDRGNFFNFTGAKSKIITKDYYELCEFFKRVARERGRVLAKIKALDSEKTDAELLTHWCLILEEDKKRSLVLIPREDNDISDAKKFIDERRDEKGDKTLLSFQSLTLRALEKLCFKEGNNTFKREIKKEINPFPKYKREFYENGSEIDGDKRLIEFYQKVLETRHAKREVSKYRGIENVTKKDYDKFDDPLSEFKKDLEQCCYAKKNSGDESRLTELKEKYGASVFLIDSLDLRTERENTLEKIEKIKEKYGERGTDALRTVHDETTQKKPTAWWKKFWTNENEDNEYPTRLNPELKIFWREPRESRVRKYGKDGKLYDPVKKNRFLTSQYTLATTVTLNATNKSLDFSWNKEENVNDKIKSFNDEFNKNNGNQWVYGIDRGLKELATLCIVKFKDENPEFPNIPLYKLNEDKTYYQDENKKTSHVGNKDEGFGGPIKNVSKFIDKINDEKWFSGSVSGENACIDLTTAKVVKGNIIENGDVQTLLNLKETVAKRKLYELYRQRKINQDSKIILAKILKIKTKNGELVDLYRFTEYQKKSLEKRGKQVTVRLEEYLKRLLDKDNEDAEPSIEKINHLRDAMTSNIVGVVKFLHKKFPAKRIALENLDEFKEERGRKFIEDQLSQSDEYIGRRLEWALYRAFQNEGMVPPNVKETILLKDKFNETQFGIIQFVKTSGTSRNCPSCDFEIQKNKRTLCMC